MSKEKKTVELKDEELEKVSGGGAQQIQSGWKVIINMLANCESWESKGCEADKYLGNRCAVCKYCECVSGTFYCTFSDKSTSTSDTTFDELFPDALK